MTVTGFEKNDHTQMLISSALASGRFPHTAIFEGGLPEERLSLAVKTAQVLLCDGGPVVPCGECANCRKIAHGTHPDVIFLKPEKKENSKNESYFVDYIRQIRDLAYVIPNEAELKIFILEEAHIMNDQAQNAFLKILEEPPQFTRFILLTPTKSVYLPTILSRAGVFSLGGETRDKKNGISRERAEAAAIAVAEAIPANTHFELVRAAGVFDKNQDLLKEALPVLNEIFMNALKVKFSAGEKENLPEICSVLAAKLTRRNLLKLIDEVNALSESLRQNANLNLTTARLCTLFKSAGKEQE